MLKLLAFASSILFSIALVAAFGWWVLLATFGLSLLTLLLSTAPEGATLENDFMAGTQPAAL